MGGWDVLYHIAWKILERAGTHSLWFCLALYNEDGFSDAGLFQGNCEYECSLPASCVCPQCCRGENQSLQLAVLYSCLGAMQRLRGTSLPRL